MSMNARNDDDFGMPGRGYRKARTQNLGGYNTNFDDIEDPFGKNDDHMMKKSRTAKNGDFNSNYDERNPFAKGDTRMMGGGNERGGRQPQYNGFGDEMN